MVSDEQAKAVVRVSPDGTVTRLGGHVRRLRRVITPVWPAPPPVSEKPMMICTRQRAQSTAYRLIARTVGQWEKDAGNEGAHYMDKHPFKDEGIVCANCVFYRGPRACELVKGDIDPTGICKLWVIPEGYLKQNNGGNESNA